MPNRSLLKTTAEGHATLSIVESLLIALSDLKLMSVQDFRDVLTDALTAHRGAGGTQPQLEQHESIAAIIDRVCTSKNGVSRPAADA